MAVLEAPPRNMGDELRREIHEKFARQQVLQYEVARTSASERKKKLRRLLDALLKREKEIEAALWKDLRKGPTETVISEYGYLCTEIRHVTKSLSSWLTPKQVSTPLTIFGSSSYIRPEPKGVVLIISPWNYPVQLALTPVIGAIAAGNCVMLKPSEYTPHSNAILKTLLAECFDPEEVCLYEGDASVSQTLLELPFNHIYFTGSPGVGKVVMAAAAKHLTSVTLELGGKSPTIVDETADLDNAANKIAWLKTMNAGQICIAPDYVLVHESVKAALVEKIDAAMKRFYGSDTEARRQSPDICRLIHQKHFDRLKGMLDDAVANGGRVLTGGVSFREELYMETTVLDGVPENHRLWEEEIFGPILPVRTFKRIEEAVGFIRSKPHSLAMYVFSRNKKNVEYVLSETRNGGTVVNDVGVHYYNHYLPFGGVGNSGLGKGHGEYSFNEFSNMRGVVYQTRFLPTTDLMLPPYGRTIGRLILAGIKRLF